MISPSVISVRKAPWWVAVVTTVVMALSGASGAIFNYLENRSAKRSLQKEAATGEAVQTVWVREQVQAYESTIAELKADARVRDAVIAGLKSRLELLERRQGHAAMEASEEVQAHAEVLDVEEVVAEYRVELRKSRPEKPSRKHPAVQQMIQAKVASGELFE